MLLTDTNSLIKKVEAEKVQEDFYKENIYLTSEITQKIQNITIIQITKR